MQGQTTNAAKRWRTDCSLNVRSIPWRWWRWSGISPGQFREPAFEIRTTMDVFVILSTSEPRAGTDYRLLAKSVRLDRPRARSRVSGGRFVWPLSRIAASCDVQDQTGLLRLFYGQGFKGR